MADPLQHALGVQGLADDRAVSGHRWIWLADRASAIPLVSAALLLAVLSGCSEDRAAFPQSLDSWIAHRQQLEETVWADELIAQQYERTLVALWDALLRADRNDVPGAKSKIFASIDFDTLTIGTLESM